jgi:hypothetical protein
MPATTIYVVQPFSLSDEGDLVAAEPIAAQSSDQAVRMARTIAPVHEGVIAFSRTGDAMVGEYQPAVVLMKIGEVPDSLE